MFLIPLFVFKNIYNKAISVVIPSLSIFIPSSLQPNLILIGFKAILGSMCSFMLVSMYLYIKYLVIVMLSTGKRLMSIRNRVGCIYFNFEIIYYKLLLDLLNPSLELSRDDATPNFTTIQDNMSDDSFKEEILVIPHHKVC